MAESVQRPDRIGLLHLLPMRWSLFALPRSLVGYVLAIDLAACALMAWLLPFTPIGVGSAVVALVLVSCAALNIEALRRMGEPSGIFADLHAAWTLPVAFLLPPAYALLTPIPLTLISHYRVRKSFAHRRVFNVAAIGLTDAGAAILFRLLVGGHGLAGSVSTGAWLDHPLRYTAAGGFAALVAAVANNFLVVVAVRLSSPERTIWQLIADTETRLLQLVEACCGLLVTVLAVVALPLIVVAIPPMLLLQRSVLHGQLNAAARIDTKTGLLNAGTWNREAERELAVAKRSGAPLALLLIDLDHFKLVNDSYGHLFGDQVLQAVAAALGDQVRSSDLAGRFGGEEFVLLLPGAATSRARAVANRLHTQIGALSVTPEGTEPIRITVSIGIALLGDDGSDVTELLAAADAALYHAKNTGRNRTCLAAELG